MKTLIELGGILNEILNLGFRTILDTWTEPDRSELCDGRSLAA